jgi:crotonobetainyl-CoA:carnitine CoA-transferase CaiB-like acyl-CoA transferase
MSEMPLDGVNVLDFSWVMAGPSASRIFADYGATVVRVESATRIDTARTMAPFVGGKPGTESSIFYQNVNAGKRCLTLDLATDAGREVVRDLARWANVVCESFSPRVMRSWGLDYAALRDVKPDIIMISTCLMGQTGPLAGFAGFGSLASAISGYHNMTGWPDRAPAGPFGAYTDTVAPRFMAIAVLAALEHRRRTGQGQYIDQSQAESALHFLAPALLDFTVNGRVQMRAGNSDAHQCPHGVYPTSGDDQWIAVAVTNDDQWRALCDAIGRADLAADERNGTVDGRLAHRDEIDAAVSAWTAERSPAEGEAALQAQGVPASAVQGGRALYTDPQLHDRGHFVEVPHPEHERITVEGSRFRFSRTPAVVERSGPTLGGDNQFVLQELLGYSDDHIAELVAAGVLQ